MKMFCLVIRIKVISTWVLVRMLTVHRIRVVELVNLLRMKNKFPSEIKFSRVTDCQQVAECNLNLEVSRLIMKSLRIRKRKLEFLKLSYPQVV